MSREAQAERETEEDTDDLTPSMAAAMSIAERVLTGEEVEDDEVMGLAAFAMESIDLIRDLEKQAAYLKGWQDGNRELHRTAEEED